MANQSKMTIRVVGTRSGSTLTISTTGRYGALSTGGIRIYQLNQPLQPTSSQQAFWESVLALATAQIEAL